MLSDHIFIDSTAMRRGLWLLWHAIRLPLLALLQAIAPAVRLALRTLALLGVLMSFFFKFLGVPDFPFLGMLAMSVGFMLTLMAYDAAIRVLSSQHPMLFRER
jgi:hypothetical protein